ncbi:hypothetical protein [Patulibacter minatonensis]|uniref:hypothetical protein n=1 Tax=Patulibacter minatonensis TaxID=298163 RepID=UPI00047D480E|nr:hypothetical protein [Patulibacter minatonensis]
MQRRVPAVLTLLALFCAPVLAGCGDDDAPEASFPTGSTTTETPVTTAPDPSPPKTPAEGQGDPASPRTGPAAPSSTTAPSGPTGELTPPGAEPAPTTPAETTVERPAKPVYCPGEGGGKSPKAKDRFDARDLLSLSTAEAKAVAKKKGCVVRVVRRDGVDLVRTMDYSNARVNVTETKGRIVRIGGIG